MALSRLVTHLLLSCLFIGVHADCTGRQTFTGNNGTILSNPEGTNYASGDHYCEFVIVPTDPTVTNIVLEFEYFDTEYRYDILVIQDGPNGWSNPQLRWFSGDQLDPTTLTTVSSGPGVTLIFWTDAQIVGRGFKCNWYASHCPAACSNHGTCSASSTCACDEGYTGPSCADQLCLNNCGGIGTCIQELGVACDCTSNFGSECAEDFCMPKQISHRPTGKLTDRWTQGPSLANMNCGWWIRPLDANNQTYDSVTLTWQHFDTEYNYDFVEIFDGRDPFGEPAQLGNQLAKLSGQYMPPTYSSSTGSLFVRWTTDMGVEKSGFTATWASYNCPNHCGGRGKCNTGLCVCELGWTGADCTQQYCPYNCGFNTSYQAPAGPGVIDKGVCQGTSCDCNDPFSGPACTRCTNSTLCPYFQGTVCTSAVRVTELSGILQYDSTRKQKCIYVFDAPAGTDPFGTWSVTFASVTLDGMSRIRFYSSSSDLSLLAEYRGSQPIPLQSSLSPYMRIEVQTGNSDQASFALAYNFSSCGGRCQNDGFCQAGLCVCQEGYSGRFCESAYCVPGCAQSGHGVCPPGNASCVCEEGYFGPRCISSQCVGTTVSTSTAFGAISDSLPSLSYGNSNDCKWLITSTLPGPIAILFTRFQTQPRADLLMVYDGILPTSPSLVSYPLSGREIPAPILTTGRSFSLEFITDALYEYDGFELVWASQALCPLSCNSRGLCVQENGVGTCHCQNGWGGPDCSVSDYAVEIFNGLTQFNLSPLTWNYFYFNSLYVDELAVSLSVSGSGRVLGLYGSMLTWPNRSEWDDLDVARTHHPLTLSRKAMINLGVEKYRIGVYSEEASSVTLSLQTACLCPSTPVSRPNPNCACLYVDPSAQPNPNPNPSPSPSPNPPSSTVGQPESDSQVGSGSPGLSTFVTILISFAILAALAVLGIFLFLRHRRRAAGGGNFQPLQQGMEEGAEDDQQL